MKKSRSLTVVLIIMVVVAAVTLASSFVGVKLYAVSSPSMRKALSVGDLVVVVPQKFENLKEKDIITFVYNEDLDTATHRVIEKDINNRTFKTKGDNNENADGSPVKYENVVGKVVFSVPILGYALTFLSTFYGKLILWTILAMFLILIIFWKEDKPEDSSKEEASEK